MISTSETVRALLDTGASFTYHLRVASWLGDTQLADDVPVAAANEEGDRGLSVPERVTFTVPREADGYDWTPTTDTHPLAAAGQTLKVSLGIGQGADGIEWFQRGEFLIQETDQQGESISVTAVGLLALIDEARFVAPFQPTGTIGSTVRELIEPALTANLENAPSDRNVPTSAVNWDTDRLAALYELMDAWPADVRVNEQGYLEIIADTVPTTDDTVRAFSEDTGGTVIEASGSSTRDGGFNVVVATGQSADGNEVRGIAYVNSGPWQYGVGAANPLPVPFGYSSPLLTTNGQCTAAATTVLRRKMRQAVLRQYTVKALPDPTLQLGDPVLMFLGDGEAFVATIEGISLPYTATGPMTLKVVSVE